MSQRFIPMGEREVGGRGRTESLIRKKHTWGARKARKLDLHTSPVCCFFHFLWPFHSADTSYGCWGELGLYCCHICKQVTGAHGVNAQEGKGAASTISCRAPCEARESQCPPPESQKTTREEDWVNDRDTSFLANLWIPALPHVPLSTAASGTHTPVHGVGQGATVGSVRSQKMHGASQCHQGIKQPQK